MVGIKRWRRVEMCAAERLTRKPTKSRVGLKKKAGKKASAIVKHRQSLRLVDKQLRAAATVARRNYADTLLRWPGKQTPPVVGKKAFFVGGKKGAGNAVVHSISNCNTGGKLQVKLIYFVRPKQERARDKRLGRFFAVPSVACSGCGRSS